LIGAGLAVYSDQTQMFFFSGGGWSEVKLLTDFDYVTLNIQAKASSCPRPRPMPRTCNCKAKAED